jgi:hypothetical protein
MDAGLSKPRRRNSLQLRKSYSECALLCAPESKAAQSFDRAAFLPNGLDGGQQACLDVRFDFHKSLSDSE